MKQRMKITPQDYANMKAACERAKAAQPATNPQYYADNGIGKDPAMRFRWDLLYASRFDVCSLYHYLNDDHIDTALRRIVSELYPTAPIIAQNAQQST